MKAAIFAACIAMFSPLLVEGATVNYKACLDAIRATDKDPFDRYGTRFFNIDSQGQVTLNGETNKEEFSSTDGGKTTSLGKPVISFESSFKPGTNRIMRYDLRLRRSQTTFYRDDQGRITAIKRASTVEPLETEQVDFTYPDESGVCVPRKVQKSDSLAPEKNFFPARPKAR